jgi:hypothetical protein
MIMKRIDLISMLLVFFAGSCDKMDISDSQSGSFIKFYNTFPVCSGVDVKEISGNGFAVIGTVESFTSGSQVFLARTDKYGNLVDSIRHYGRSLADRAYCLQVLSDGGFGILASSQNPVTERKEVYFIRTNSSGDTLWTKTIGGEYNIEASHFEVNSNGSFIMTGYTEKITSGILNKDIWIYGLDEERNSLFSPRITGGIRDDEGLHLQILENGDYAITGRTMSYPTPSTTSHAFIFITRPNGITYIPYAITSAADEEGVCIRSLDNETFLLLGNSQSAPASANADIFLRKVKVSLSGSEVIWEQIYDFSSHDTGENLHYQGNSIYILGTSSNTANLSSIAFITTGASGENPAYTSFGQGSQMSGSSFEITSDNGFIFTGANKNTESSVSAALIKTGANGSL